MPKQAQAWSEAKVKSTGHSGAADRHAVHAVGVVPGLCLQISPTGNKSWLLRYSAPGGRRREMGLGQYGPFNNLASARAAAAKARAMLLEVPPRDPLEIRQSAQATAKAASAKKMTFEQATHEFYKERKRTFKTATSAADWLASLKIHAFPTIGDTPVTAVGLDHVLKVLRPIWDEKHRTAIAVRGRLEEVLGWAAVHGHREGENPARWANNLALVMPKPAAAPKGATSQPSMALADLPRWYSALAKREGPAARALQFLALTAVRSGMVRGMPWAELDEATGVWTIPAARTKTGAEHRVPLPAPVIKFLAGQRQSVYHGPHRDSALVFPSVTGIVMRDLLLSNLMRDLHEDDIAAGGPGYLDPRNHRSAVPHGLRAAFRTWAAEAGVDRDLSEIALAHTVGSAVERAYQRSDMLERRREVMAQWAAFLMGAQAD